ncbi:MAG TPA: ACP S-malonyltransferase [Thermomicrobiales bacterium]|nr:ACP S-malonyltransferase [Thermomicrobiales bacterium]
MEPHQLDGTGIAMVFPGQGSQFVGMGRGLYEVSAAARAIFEQADQILGIPLTRLCFEGPEDELEDTLNAQPAILTVSTASLEAIRERAHILSRKITPSMVAGHSLGEFTALVAGGSLDFASALRLVRERGRLMKEAGQEQPGGMAAVIGLDDATLAAVCEEAAREGIITVANANCPGQTVISGEVQALLRAMELAKERGAKRVARLGVSIASHSPLMSRASAQLGELVAKTPLKAPQIPLVANITGQVLTTADEVRQELSHQMERPVNWTRSVREMVGGGTRTFVDVGPGQVLSGLIKRISRESETLGVGDLDLGLPGATSKRPNQ